MYLTFNFKQTLVNTLYRFSHLSLLINQWRVASTSVFLEYINMRDWGTRLDGRWERKAILCNGVKVWQGHQFKKQLMPLMSYMIYSPVCKENIGSGHELSGRCARKGPRKAATSPPPHSARTHGNSLVSSSIPAGSRHIWPPPRRLYTDRSPCRYTGRGWSPAGCSCTLMKGTENLRR